VIESFSAAGASHIDEWDGTLGSLVLGLGDKRSQYLAHRERLPAMILRAMKLLVAAVTHAHTVERLRAMCIGVFGITEFPAHAASWRSAVRRLVDEQFVTEEHSAETDSRELRIRKDSYFEQVITNYPRSSAERRYRLPPELWPEIQQRAKHQSLRQLGAEYGVSHEAIRRIVKMGSARREADRRRSA
jgi:hypothetical protein